jgi:hypothetical protein
MLHAPLGLVVLRLGGLHLVLDGGVLYRQNIAYQLSETNILV